MDNSINTNSSKYLIKRFVPYFKPYFGTLIIDLFCASLTCICELILPIIVRFITSSATDNIEALTVNTILKIGFLYMALRLVDVAANYYMNNIGHTMGARIETDMRKDLFSKFQKLSYSYYSNTKIGQLMSRITTDLFDIAEFAHHCPEEYFMAALKITIAFIILVQTDIALTIIVFAMIPLMLYFSMKYRIKMRTVFKKQRNEMGEINAQVEDSLLGIRVVKSFANESIEQKSFEKGNNRILNVKKEAYKYMAGFKCTIRFFDGAMYIFVVVIGSIFMLKGRISPSDLVAYLLYVVMLLNAVKTVVEFTEQFQRGITGIERFIEVMDEPITILNKKEAKQLTNVKGNIEFKNVKFKYSDSDDILDNINIYIKEGENVAFVGPSGSGKTTICNLIPRFYDVTEGEIYIDGEDITNLTIHSLRSNIGIVQQEVYLFSGTVLENIDYGKPGSSRENIINAAKLAGADEFISQLPNGYDTYVGERGVKLSGGQKQRISIARVFLKNPSILILDEATSALDNESEMVVQESLEKLCKGRTSITIAHRLTTIKDADRIFVLTDNGIEEEGSHKELINKGGLYSKMYKRYSS